MTVTEPNRRWLQALALGITCALVGAAGGWWWQARHVSPTERAAIEEVVHDYLLEHPEILPDAMQALQRKENAKQLASVRGDVEKAWPGEVLGNPNGKVTLVEFTDFACTYCRHSVEDVDALIAGNPQLKVVIRQLPIISPLSPDAARMGLAAAEQGKYAAFHKAMFAAGQPDKATIEAVARSVGIDMVRAQKVIAGPGIEDELARNIDLARQLGFNGTPAWVVGDTLLSGAVGRDRLAKAIAEVKG
jgi:protein-disulfide isomerase